MNIGEKIKKYRKEKKITQKQLAEMINKNIRTIQKYEANEIDIPLENILKISHALQVPYNELCTEQSDTIVNSLLSEETIHMIKNLSNNEMTNTAKNISLELSKEMQNFTNNFKDKFILGSMQSILDNFSNIFNDMDIELSLYKTECNDIKIKLTDNKDNYSKIFDTLEETTLFFNEIKHNIQSSVDRLKYYDKNNK